MRILLPGLLVALASGTLLARAGTEPPVHDRSIDEVLRLQAPESAFENFPVDTEGRPNWVEVLKRGLIQPRETLRGNPRTPESIGLAPEDGIVFTQTLGMPHVVFPHRPHVEWLACSNCHDGLFGRRRTGRGEGMEAILAGKHCGTCHGKVAFSPEGSCYRCHSLPHPGMIIDASKANAPAAGDSTELDSSPPARMRSTGRQSGSGERKPRIYPARP